MVWPLVRVSLAKGQRSDPLALDGDTQCPQCPLLLPAQPQDGNRHHRQGLGTIGRTTHIACGLPRTSPPSCQPQNRVPRQKGWVQMVQGAAGHSNLDREVGAILVRMAARHISSTYLTDARSCWQTSPTEPIRHKGLLISLTRNVRNGDVSGDQRSSKTHLDT